MKKSNLYRRFFEDGLYRITILVVMCIILAIFNENFFTMSNLMNIARQASIIAILAIGATGTILTKGIDLSLAGIMSLAGCVCGFFLTRGTPVYVAILIALLVGALFGLINGFLVAIVKIPPFVSTYGVRYIANGCALLLMGSNIFFGFPDSFQFLSIGFLGPIPILVIWALLVAFVLYIVLQKSKFGKQVYCVGANVVTARYSGIPTIRTYFLVYVISSICAAFAGVLQSSRMNAAQAGMGDTFQMLAIASIVMGGTSMAGGEGNVAGGILGALILTLIVNGMNLLNVSSLAQPLVTGTVIILTVLLDVQITRFGEKRPVAVMS
jgi:ribose transport system permease protein